MIHHDPAGRGHPYLIDPDQRVPVRPSTEEALELRATTGRGARRVQAELDRAGRIQPVDATLRGPARSEPVPDWGAHGTRAAAGHLGDLAEDGADSDTLAWSVPVPPLERGERLRYRFRSSDGDTDWFSLRGCSRSPAPAALRLAAATAELERRLVEDSTSVLDDGEQAYALRFALRLEPGERVVGFGERFNGLDQRGKLVDAVVFDQYKAQGARSYLPSPFAIVIGGGFGFHVETGHRVRFDVGRTNAAQLRVHIDLEPGYTSPEITLRLFGGSPSEVLAQFTASTGRPAPPPDWIYRFWISGNEWNSQERVLAELDHADRAGIPVGVVVVEAWSDEQTFVAFNGADSTLHPDGSPHCLADFAFAPDGPWPDPKGMVDELHERGTRILLWQIPLASSHPGQADADQRTMLKRGYCVRNADGSPYRNPAGWFHDAVLVDFTNADAREWWLEKRRYLVEEIGVDGFKTDGGEHAWHPELRYADGSRGGETNNRYPVLYGAAYHTLLASSGREPITFSRAGFTGSGAIPCHWAGDEDSTWEAFRASISAGLSAGASGIVYWGWDFAGFSGPLPTPELYLRAAAVACLCPIMQCHSEYNHHRTPSRDRTPWNVAEQTGDPRILPTLRRFVRLRERLIPYLSEQARIGIAAGKPLMRALFLESDDERIWQFPEQYLLGDDLLVAPVTREGIERLSVFIPRGDWVDPWNGEQHAGPAVVEHDLPLDRIPVFVSARKSGTLAPLFLNLDPPAAVPPSPEPAEVS
jgi:1,3-alpha-isomaltosidase